jgi:hypothetical protein
MFAGTDILSSNYLSLCPTGDDHWFNLWRMFNSIECVALNGYKYMYGDLTNKKMALYHNYNEEKNKLMFRRTANYIFGVKTVLRF